MWKPNYPTTTSPPHYPTLTPPLHLQTTPPSHHFTPTLPHPRTTSPPHYPTLTPPLHPRTNPTTISPTHYPNTTTTPPPRPTKFSFKNHRWRNFLFVYCYSLPCYLIFVLWKSVTDAPPPPPPPAFTSKRPSYVTVHVFEILPIPKAYNKTCTIRQSCMYPVEHCLTSPISVR